ncbi:hypothetical protein SERLADRAFT_410768 [Serpula lacrymans var. lacrymans S7.9]|uniref:Uncharacterized protein n=1 Tax=Serpula lacrymans var. lacrymans (strain S7.9) TaxID=578457 RepID=F8P7D2_SERL9|nr:uncharacterized protein SERLADRAFT_410768 [Serpula lacrymans var. lacrymans S7.9]EGO21348.1 hypothetical protein SERLADRAFT_410768 [Serpula lacrymans var. lacrymans S7.9]
MQPLLSLGSFLLCTQTPWSWLDVINAVTSISPYILESQHNLADDRAGWPDPRDGVVEHCVGGSAWSKYSESPPQDFNKTILYLLTRGSTNIGSVTIVTSNVIKNTADVLVHVGYHTQQALDHANVCMLNKVPGYYNTQGVGIYDCCKLS